MELVLLFFCGMFAANGVPHFVNGISGRPFHSPFARPFGKKLSSPLTNVLWGMTNFVLASAAFLLSNGCVFGFNPGFILLVAGFVLTSVGLAVLFGKRNKELPAELSGGVKPVDRDAGK
jgi:hypothetical protein